MVHYNEDVLADVVHGNEDVHVDQADLDRLRERITPAVAEGEVREVDVVAVHELGEPGSQEQENLGVCEAQEQRNGNSLKTRIGETHHGK